VSALEALARPDPRYLPTAFWFLNDRLAEAEIRRQMAGIAGAGFGGVFLHARMGRLTPYLSEPWFACVQAAIEEAALRGVRIWIYDEDNWPSGYAGGRVLALGDWTRQRYVRAEVLAATPGEVVACSRIDGIIAAFATNGRGGGSRVLERLAEFADSELRPTHPATEAVLVFHRELHRARREFCPEEAAWGYVDVFDPRVTAAFIESTYEEYYRRFGAHFGSTVAGFFFDEPQYHELGLWGDRVARFPWSEHFPEVYRNRFRRDLVDDLPLLLWEIDDYREARASYYRLLSEEFAANFTARLADWCTAHGVQLTGHVILEEFPRQAVRCVGDPMAHYAAEHVPGIDHLGRDLDLRAYWSSARVLCKQAQSAAHQLGKERILCETFAGATNYFGLPDQKWMGDWLMASGVNLLCYHALHYSLRGYRKRDYPPTLNFQQPWFRYSAVLAAHVARVSQASCMGARAVGVLLIHPLESFWATQSDTNFTGEDDELTDSFRTVSQALSQSGFDWDFGSESYLERWGRVDGSRLIVGRAAYAVVIVPPVCRLRDATIDLVGRFCRDGGRVLVIESAREPAGAGRSAHSWFPAAVSVGSWSDARLRQRVAAETSRILPPQLQVLPEGAGAEGPCDGIGDLVFQERRLEEGRLYFVASSARTPRRVRCRFPCPGEPLALDTLTGEVVPLPFHRDGPGTVVDLELGGPCSALVEFVERGVSQVGVRRGEPDPDRREVRLVYSEHVQAPVTIHDHNALILDRADLVVGARRHRGLFMPEAAEAARAERPGTPFRLDFSFESSVAVASPAVAVERSAAHAIAVDGTPLDVVPRGWFVDAHLELVPLSGMKAGRHSISIIGRIGEHELEPIYLVGAFGVRVHGGVPRVTPQPVTLHAGSWTDQGLPFYAGRVTYHLSFNLPRLPDRGRLDFPREGEKDPRHLRMNGIEVAPCIVPPFRVDVTRLLRRGRNLVDVTVATHLRNFTGPHHAANEDEVDCFSPSDFFPRGHCTPRYLLKPAGILGAVRLELSWADRRRRGTSP